MVEFLISFTKFFVFLPFFLLSGATELSVSYVKIVISMRTLIALTGLKSGSRPTSRRKAKIEAAPILFIVVFPVLPHFSSDWSYRLYHLSKRSYW